MCNIFGFWILFDVRCMMEEGRCKETKTMTITETGWNIILNRIRTLEEYEQRDKGRIFMD